MLIFVYCISVGVALVHMQWVKDSVQAVQLQPLAPYLLPSGCASLHGYNVFPVRTVPVEALLSGRSGKQRGHNRALQEAVEPVLTGVRVLNLAGMTALM